MGAIRRFFAKVSNLFFRGQAEQELAREVTSHLAMLEDEFASRGMTPEEASLAARRSYGGVEQAKELHRAERSFVWIEQAAQDFRHAARSLARNPGFTFIAVIALALGIGVNTALFTTYNAIALKPLPVADPDHVVRLERWFRNNRGDDQYAFSYPEYTYLVTHSREFSGIVATGWETGVAFLKGTGAQGDSASEETIQGQLVSANYFASLGIRAQLGRTFFPNEDSTPSANAVAVLSYQFWQSAYQGDARVLGETIKLNGAALTIVGVTPQEFTGTSLYSRTPAFWAPLSMQAQLAPGREWLNDPDQQRLQIFARLKASASQAQAETALLVRQFGAAHPQQDPTIAVTLPRTSYFDALNSNLFTALVALFMLIVGLVLLVACANVGNMLLARGVARQREISTRMALGAGRGRLIRQLLTESVLLSLLGGAAGLAVSRVTANLLWALLTQIPPFAGERPFVPDTSPDVHVFAYALAVSIAAGILFGLFPALQFTKPDVATALKEKRSRMRGVLVGAQVAVSMLLLVTAGLLGRGLARSQGAQPGFETRDVFFLSADFGQDPVAAAEVRRRLAGRLRESPVVASVGIGRPPYMGTWTPGIVVGAIKDRTLGVYAAPEYLDALRIPLLRGRTFTRDEETRNAPVAVISQATARRFWPDQDPLGKRFQLDKTFTGELTGYEVVGVVQDVRWASLTRIDPALVYVLPEAGRTEGMLVRVRGSHQQAMTSVRAAVQDFDKDLSPSLELLNFEDSVVSSQRALTRVPALFAAGLAILSLALASLGIYGVMAYLVSQSTREIGVRMALGASARTLLRDIILQGLRPVLAGLTLGVCGASVLSWGAHVPLSMPGSFDLLYGVPFYDPITFVGISVFVVCIAALASAVPARRALRVDPMVALRYE